MYIGRKIKMKNSQNRHWQKRKATKLSGFTVVTGLCLLVAIFTIQIVSAVGISTGYKTNEEIEQGMIVSLSSDLENSVVKSTLANESRIAGVAVSSTSGAISLSSPTSDIQVSSDGSVKVYVSDLGGEIKKGDYIGLSNLRGIGVKASSSNQYVLGTALEDVDFSSNYLGSTNVVGASEENIESKIALTSVMLEIKDNPVGNEKAKPFLVVAGESIAGKPVSFPQVIVSALIIVVVFVIAGALLFAAIKGSFISIGRNPLAVKSIHGSLLRVSVTSGLIILIGIGIAYAILLV